MGVEDKWDFGPQEEVCRVLEDPKNHPQLNIQNTEFAIIQKVFDVFNR